MKAMLVQSVMTYRERAQEVGISSPEMGGVNGTRLAILIIVVVTIVAAALVARYMMKKRGLTIRTLISGMRSKSDVSVFPQPGAAKYCADCGAPIAQGSAFCPKCGRRLG